jgi:hypothetical protein
MAWHTRGWFIGVGACFVLSSCSNPPAEPEGSDVARAEERAEPAPRAASTAKLRDELARRLSRSTEGLTPQRTQAGSMRLDFKGRFRHVGVATQGPDGRIRERCVSSPAELDAVLAQQQQARQP